LKACLKEAVPVAASFFFTRAQIVLKGHGRICGF
jgi:hypothetical protein